MKLSVPSKFGVGGVGERAVGVQGQVAVLGSELATRVTVLVSPVSGSVSLDNTPAPAAMLMSPSSATV